MQVLTARKTIPKYTRNALHEQLVRCFEIAPQIDFLLTTKLLQLRSLYKDF